MVAPEAVQASGLLTEALFFSAVSILLVVVAAVLLLVPPGNLPRRLLAYVLLAIASYNLIAWSDLYPSSALPGTGDLWFRWLHDPWAIYLGLVLAFVWVYPSRPPLRSWHTLALASAAVPLLLGAVLWLFARGALYDPRPGEFEPGTLANIVAYLTWADMARVGFTLALASAAVRAAALPRGEARAAWIVLPATLAWTFTWVGVHAYNAAGWAVGLEPGGVAWLGAVPPGDCCRLYPALVLLGDLAAVGLAAWLAARHRSWMAAGLIGFGLLVPLHLNAFPINYFFMALAPMYAVTRYGAFDTRRAPGWVVAAAAVAAFVATFLLVNLALVIQFGESTLGLLSGLLLGTLVGAVAAAAVLPQGRVLLHLAPLGGDTTDSGSRLAPYRVALERELTTGATPEQASERLRDLRADLRITDQEHAAMAHVLAAGAARPGREELQPGQLFLGRYRVQRFLGKGGHGRAWLCRDEVVKRDVVLKVLRAAEPGRDGLAQVLREAQAIGAVQHPNVVTLLDVQRVGDEAFILMEYCEGGSLEDRLTRGALPPEDFRALARELFDALEAVHAAGLVHRDVKPSNVLRTRNGQAKLADFGVAHVPGFETTAGGGSSTGAGAVGTVRYMSPEQARGRKATPRSDLYSAGATLFEAWTGEPYLKSRPGESPVELQLRAASLGPFDRPVQPAALHRWFAQALDPAPERRFPDAPAMRQALDQALEQARGPLN